MNGKRRRFQCCRMSLSANNGSPLRTGFHFAGKCLGDVCCRYVLRRRRPPYSDASLEASGRGGKYLMSMGRLSWLAVVSAAAFAPLLLFLVNGADFSGIAS